MSDWSGKMVVCKRPEGNKLPLLQLGGEYQVLEERGDFVLIHNYMRLPNGQRVDGWWKRDRFELKEGGVNA